MSMLRKTTVTVAIVGAGLGSLSGAAFAHTHHGSSHGSSCTNNIKALNSSKVDALVSAADGDQTIVATNICHILNDNNVLSNNTVTPPPAPMVP